MTAVARIVPATPTGGTAVDAVRTETSMQVARPFAPDAATLGLDGRVPLLGGGARLLPGGLPLTIGMVHGADFLRAVAEACRTQSSGGRDWYSHGALALVGPKGVGRGHAVRRLAAAAGLPLFVADASTPAGRAQIAGTAAPGCEALPPLAVVAVAASRCANPIVLVEGLAARTDVANLLGPFVDPDRGARFRCDRLGVVLDLSQVNWIIQLDGAEDATRLPEGWASVVRFRAASAPERRLVLLSLVTALKEEAAPIGLPEEGLVASIATATRNRGVAGISESLAMLADATLSTHGWRP